MVINARFPFKMSHHWYNHMNRVCLSTWAPVLCDPIEVSFWYFFSSMCAAVGYDVEGTFSHNTVVTVCNIWPLDFQLPENVQAWSQCLLPCLNKRYHLWVCDTPLWIMWPISVGWTIICCVHFLCATGQSRARQGCGWGMKQIGVGASEFSDCTELHISIIYPIPQ